MTKLLLASVLLLVFGAAVLGQDTCSKPPKDPAELKCCEEVKWDDLEPMKQCEKTWSDKPFCATECIVNSTNVVMNGQVKSDNLKTLFEKALKNDASYIPVAVKAFEECYPMAKEKMGGKNLQMEGCNALPGVAVECMFVKMFLTCPAAKWKDNKDCNDIKAYFTKCPIHIPPQAKA